MENQINELNNKLIELEGRVYKLERINKRRMVIKIVTLVITLVLVILLVILYISVLSRIYGEYLNLL